MSRDDRFIDKELSWLKFNERVLNEALDPRTPLLERLGFLQIFLSNLDEFYMKRVGGLKRQVLAKVVASGHSGFSPQERLAKIGAAVTPLLQTHAKCFKETLLPELKKNGIDLVNYSDLTKEEQKFVNDFFKRSIFPVLTPLAVDPGHPFPFISNLSVSFGILMRHPKNETEELFARIKVPAVFPAWIRLGDPTKNDKVRFASLYEVIGMNLGALFPGMKIIDVMMFRITRNADIEKDAEDAEDLLAMVAEELKERRFARVVRLEHGPKANPKILAILKEELSLHNEDVIELPLFLECYSLRAVIDIQRPELHFTPWIPTVPAAFADPETNLFDVIRHQDVLVHHPYESFSSSVERFLRTAVEDKKVLAIKMTLYRTGDESPFIPLLIRAAESGKQVVCLVELQARFDEERNILVAQSLEKAGVHVVYGVMGLKTHSKIILTIRQEADGVRSYIHVGTGNYNAKTAQLYTDLGLFTAKPEFTDDVVHLFHYLTGRSLEWDFRKLLIAPIDMKASFLRMIEREKDFGKKGLIIAKMNSLEDKEVIEALYTASSKGVKITLIVRGVCTLKPGVKGLSENITVKSIIGRFLEHSRIYYFQNGKSKPEEGEYFIGSADWMSRNLNSRVEAIAPVEDVSLRGRLWEILSIMQADHRQGWEMQSSGEYKKLTSKSSDETSTHELLMKIARSQG